jgi:aminoglycoside 3-N-acetyltransferase
MSRSLPDGRPVVTQAMIEAGLREAGLRAGDIVVAHSALRSFGWVEGGEDAVIDALIAVAGPAGTVCMPTLSYGNYGPRRPPPPFDPRTTPGIVGRIPERFRQRPGVMRSLHPTHSVAAFGARTEELLKGHELSLTPCGPDSPWGRIARAGGSVLMMGVGTFYCTMFHGPEEEAEPDARCTRPVPCRIVTEAGERTVHLRLHRSYEGAVSDRAGMEGVLEAEGLLRRARAGNSTLLLIDARGLWDLSLRLLRARPARAIDRLRAKVRHDFRRMKSGLRRAL